MNNIIGHDWAVKRLSSAMDNHTLAQSHLFVGAAQVGKSTLAKAVARALISRTSANPQRAALLVDQLKHPDLHWLEAEGEGANRSIKVDTVRELLRALSLSPVESKHRVAVINDAHLMSDSSKNAILKTLEEPNPRVVMILIAPSVDSVLPTIASRCQVLNLRAVPIGKITAALQTRGVEKSQAEFVARLSRGRAGWAIAAVQDDTPLQARKDRLEQLRELLSAGAIKRFAFAEQLAKEDGDTLQATLDEWILFWRDAVQLLQADANAPLRNNDYRDLIHKVAEQHDLTAMNAMLHKLGETATYIRQNVNVRLALDSLLLKLPLIA